MRLAIPFALVLIAACETEQVPAPALQPCSVEWYQLVERTISDHDTGSVG